MDTSNRIARPLPMLCEVVGGLEGLARDELDARCGDRVRIERWAHGEVRCTLRGSPHALLGLRTVLAAYLALSFPVPRPRGLLGHEHFEALIGGISLVRGLHPPGAFATFRLGAAGSDSAVLTRLREEIARRTGLVHAPDEADLLLRLRLRPAGAASGAWEVLIRLTPRPLSARPWRVYNYPGALNATIAAAMIEATEPRPADRVLNLLCGSGTLLVERLLRGPAALAVGCDSDAAVLAGARLNVGAAGLAGAATLARLDATALPFPDASFDVICLDPPWGQLIGSHERNVWLYPRVLAEAARVAVPGARLVMVSDQARLLERVLDEGAMEWAVRGALRLHTEDRHPRIYALERRPSARRQSGA